MLHINTSENGADVHADCRSFVLQKSEEGVFFFFASTFLFKQLKYKTKKKEEFLTVASHSQKDILSLGCNCFGASDLNIGRCLQTGWERIQNIPLAT